MPKLHEMLESKFLKKEDVDPPTLVTITDVKQVNVALADETPELKWAAVFKQFKKPLVLNRTNIQLLAKNLKSEDSEDWLGKNVVLYCDETVTFRGEMIGGVRIRAAKPRPSTREEHEAAISELEDDIPL